MIKTSAENAETISPTSSAFLRDLCDSSFSFLFHEHGHKIDNRQAEIENPNAMDLDSLRRFCLAFPHATEDMPWADDLCFKVGGKIFAGVSLGAPPHGISLKCSPERFAELVEREGMGPAPYVGRYKWIQIDSMNRARDAELMGLIRESYDLVSAKTRPEKHRTATRSKKKRK